jgi:hypothetical protein
MSEEVKSITIELHDLPHAENFEIKLTPNQHTFYAEKELDGTVFSELVNAEFMELAGKVVESGAAELLKGVKWDKDLFRAVLRRWRAEHDDNDLTLEDIDMATLTKLAEKVDFAKCEAAVRSIPNQIKALVKVYRRERKILANAYSTITDRELAPIGFPRASSLYKLRDEVLDHLKVE